MEKFAIAVSSALDRLEQSSSSPSARRCRSRGGGGGGGGGGEGHSGTEGGRTRVTYFAEEGVFFLRPPHVRDFFKEG